MKVYILIKEIVNDDSHIPQLDSEVYVDYSKAHDAFCDFVDEQTKEYNKRYPNSYFSIISKDEFEIFFIDHYDSHRSIATIVEKEL
jgi:hypothetical protein